ncbi:ester cyclase [Streptomyces tropicalis]|uniref:Ester cyclase n=1 Tax=Streptomyces tropicalis TaxID=3034234 RepID=A0ABT6A6U2_9ACTN|nr:ester cyclase [Streptomyces tropicalis]MDF3300374.1 ester cyclase [Streptomyces tropicalis]
MIPKRTTEAESVAIAVAAPGRRRKVIGALTGLAVAAALTTVAVPAAAQAQGSPGASTVHAHHHNLSPRQVSSAFYASYNGDLAAGFDRYISKDLVLHGFDGPGKREDWVQADLGIKAGISDYRMTVEDQIVEGDKTVTRWTFGGVHTGTIFGIPASGHQVHLSGISIDRVAHGQIVEHWSEGNFDRFLAELSGK